jgi:hypothetical protein
MSHRGLPGAIKTHHEDMQVHQGAMASQPGIAEAHLYRLLSNFINRVQLYEVQQEQIQYTRGYNCTLPKRYNCTLIHFQKDAKCNLYMQKYNKLMRKKKL